MGLFDATTTIGTDLFVLCGGGGGLCVCVCVCVCGAHSVKSKLSANRSFINTLCCCERITYCHFHDYRSMSQVCKQRREGELLLPRRQLV